jgi:hypothetical protein
MGKMSANETEYSHWIVGVAVLGVIGIAGLGVVVFAAKLLWYFVYFVWTSI